MVYAFGQRWGPEQGVTDKVFGFKPGNGIHDIHMNQGNNAAYRNDDGVWQDGGLVLHFPASNQWVGVFLAFQSQAWHTDDATGHAIEVVEEPDEDRAHRRSDGQSCWRRAGSRDRDPAQSDTTAD